MQNLDQSISSRPNEEDSAKLVIDSVLTDLYPHQKEAVEWMRWRERDVLVCSGGINADDMGLGKTFSVVSLILKQREDPYEGRSTLTLENFINGGTLIITPLSLFHQWKKEMTERVKEGRMHKIDYLQYYDKSRESDEILIARTDVVLTNYHTVLSDYKHGGPLFKIKWRRVVLDEAHVVRNHNTGLSQAVCELEADSRWCVTGTPVHNYPSDLYSLYKFLRFDPFQDESIWTDLIDKNDEVIRKLRDATILRRTKEQLPLGLPQKLEEVVKILMNEQEREIYQHVLEFVQQCKLFSKTLERKVSH